MIAEVADEGLDRVARGAARVLQEDAQEVVKFLLAVNVLAVLVEAVVRNTGVGAVTLDDVGDAGKVVVGGGAGGAAVAIDAKGVGGDGGEDEESKSGELGTHSFFWWMGLAQGGDVLPSKCKWDYWTGKVA